MPEDVIIEPMTEEFILWRCLHNGPLARDTIQQWPIASSIPWQRYQERNLPLLLKLTQAYGACAMVAHNNGRIVSKLRFYPKAICDMAEAGSLCLQQEYPAGPQARHRQPPRPAWQALLSSGFQPGRRVPAHRLRFR